MSNCKEADILSGIEYKMLIRLSGLSSSEFISKWHNANFYNENI